MTADSGTDSARHSTDGGVPDLHPLARALDVAIEWHGDQLRKGTPTPYVAHLLAVTALVLEAGGTLELARSCGDASRHRRGHARHSWADRGNVWSIHRGDRG